MSVSILPVPHLAAIVAYGSTITVERLEQNQFWIDQALRMFRLLENTNLRAYEIRYPENSANLDWVNVNRDDDTIKKCLAYYREHPVGALQLLQLVRCFRYQADEALNLNKPSTAQHGTTKLVYVNEKERVSAFLNAQNYEALNMLQVGKDVDWVLSDPVSKAVSWYDERDRARVPFGPINEWTNK